jgi:hypothetical protein
MVVWLRGDKLSAQEQQQVLRTYVHRFTQEHRPQWALRSGNVHDRPHYASDDEWLANTDFAVTTKGKLDRRVRHCMSHDATWPEGK